MNIDIQRKIDRYVGALICRFFSLFSRNSQRLQAPRPVEGVLVILLSEMGSLVLGYPMFREIKRKYPDAALYGLLFKKNREILDLLDVTAPENILTIDDKSPWSLIRDCLQVLIRMRRLKLDIVIDCELFARISSIFSFLSGANIRVGFHPHKQEGLYRGDFINRPVMYNPYSHISKQFLTLVGAIDSTSVPISKIEVDTGDLKAPSIRFEPGEIEGMKTRLIRDFPSLGNKKLILVYPGGGLLPIRAWPLEYFSLISSQLIQKGYAVGVVGLAVDKPLAEIIQAECRAQSCIDLTGYTKSIRELMLIFQFADLLITNDGGPGQFAAMTPLPAIIFYGPETPHLYGPVDEKATIFYEPLPCTPCLTAYNHRNSPCDGDNQCLKRIAPERVMTKALEILENQ